MFFEQISRYIICALGVAVLLFSIISLLRRKGTYTDKAILTNTTTGEKITLRDFETSVGRSKACDVVIEYGTVSRFHAVISLRKKSWYLADTFSKTGTFINMKKVNRRAPLKNGDVISFGTAAYKFETPFTDGESVVKPRAKQTSSDTAKNTTPVYVSALLDDSSDEVYCLDVSECIIGRDEEKCDIVLNAPSVSRVHARLYHNSRGWMIEDKGSKAGTKINGEIIEGKTKINDSDKIILGSVKLTFCLRFKRVK